MYVCVRERESHTESGCCVCVCLYNLANVCWFSCVCMCGCMHACVYVCVHACVYVCVNWLAAHM